MRHVVEQPDEARERGRRGKAAVEERQSLERAAEFLARPHPAVRAAAARAAGSRDGGSRAAEFLAFGPSLAWDAHSRGPAGRWYRMLLRRLLRPYTMRQRELETQLVHGIEDLSARVTGSKPCAGSRSALRELEGTLASLHAKPYVAGEPSTSGSPHLAFESVFRGPEEGVRELVAPYVEILRGREPVLDLGCGRGELLELLREAGIDAEGVDADEGMVARCLEKGLSVALMLSRSSSGGRAPASAR